MNKKLINQEINNIKYLLEYKKGKVVSEQKFQEGVSEEEGEFFNNIDESGYEDLKSRVNNDKEISTKAHKFGENFSIIVSGIIRALKLNFLKIELYKLETLINEHRKRDINNPFTSDDLEFYDIDLNEIINKSSELSSAIDDLKENSDYFNDGGNWLEQTEKMLDNLSSILSSFVKQ